MRELVRLEVASILGLSDPSVILDDSSFLELGFDSLSSMRLGNRLATVTGLDLPSTLLFEYATPAALATHLDEQLATDLDAAGVYALLEEIDELDEASIAMTTAEQTAISELLDRLSTKWRSRT